MQFLRTLLLSLVTTMLVASAASALVTIDAITTAVSPLRVGDTFEVDILASWDGTGSLVGVFSSHVWDDTQLELIDVGFPNAPTFEARPTLFRGGTYDPVLTRLGTIAGGIAGDDLSSTARTVQYASIQPLNGATSAADNQLITRLIFRVVGGVGEGPVEVVGAILFGDTGALGDSFTFGSNVSLLVVPEPGAALLLGLGLACLAASRRRDA